MAIGAHVVGLGLIAANKTRVTTQPGARANTMVKSALTAAASGLTAYSGALGRHPRGHRGTRGAGRPSREQQRPQSLVRNQLARLGH
jgi:hypothetical protein